MTAEFDIIANAAHDGGRTRRLLLVAFFNVLAVIPLVIYLGNRNYLGLRETKAWSMAGHNPFDREKTFRPINPIGGPIQKELLLAIQLAATANGTIILTVANKAGMLHEMPDLLSTLRTMPGAPLGHTIVVVALDRAALQLCQQLHHPVLCVLDDEMTSANNGGNAMGQSKSSSEVDIETQHISFGTAQFHRIGWRRVELVRDVLQQGYSVLSMDLDIVLFKNLLDAEVNPWMAEDVDLWTSVSDGELNCGLYFVRPSVEGLAFVHRWVASHDTDDAWDQKRYNDLLNQKPPILKWGILSEKQFADLCTYTSARDALLGNPACMLDPNAFADVFEGHTTAIDSWDTVFGWHAPCCFGTKAVAVQCKTVATRMALLRWRLHEKA